MKKFIAAFDGLRFSESTLQYALFLARQSNAHLVGVFLEDFTRHSYSMADVTTYEGSFDAHIQELNQKDKEERNENVARFEEVCNEAGIHYSVHRDKNIAIQDLLHESIYSDLLIIESDETLTRYEEKLPTRFIKDLLNEVQCPVVVVPEKFKAINKIILLYDGAPASVYAVKLFSYVLPALKALDSEVITVKAADESLHVPDSRWMKEFMKRHYPNAEYVVLKGMPEDEIIKYLTFEQSDVLVVLGAYQRSSFSRLFKPSMADHLLHHLKLPLFIAHNKS